MLYIKFDVVYFVYFEFSLLSCCDLYQLDAKMEILYFVFENVSYAISVSILRLCEFCIYDCLNYVFVIVYLVF